MREINGSFGHIGRDGKFKHIILAPAYGDYPTDDYPQNDYPVLKQTPHIAESSIAETIEKSMYRQNGVKFEEYTVKEIDKLQIRSEENDIGTIVGTGTNAYVIEGNFLVFGKTAAELEVIANNAFANMKGRSFKPYQAENIGLPYVEVGDMIKFNMDIPIASYMLKRTLTGIQALKDETSADGSEEREQNFGVNNEIMQLQGKSATLKKLISEVSVLVEDLGLHLSGEIAVLAGQVILKVDSDGNVGYVELTADPDTNLTTIKLKADQHILEGLVTVNGKL